MAKAKKKSKPPTKEEKEEIAYLESNLLIKTKILPQYERLSASPLVAKTLSSREAKEKWKSMCEEKRDKFFFVLDIRNMKKSGLENSDCPNFYASYDDPNFIMVNGASKMLFGIKSNQDLTHQKFISLIHPAFQKLYLVHGAASYELALKKESREIVKPLKQKYIVTIPMKVKSNTKEGYLYRWIRQTSWAYQLNDQNCLLSHLNEYQFVGPFNEKRKRNIEVYFEEGEMIQAEWTAEIAESIHLYLLHKNILNPQKKDIEVLRMLADGKGFTEISKMIKIQAYTKEDKLEENLLNKETVKKYGKRIIPKINAAFGKNYKNLKEVAVFLSELGILGGNKNI